MAIICLVMNNKANNGNYSPCYEFQNIWAFSTTAVLRITLIICL